MSAEQEQVEALARRVAPMFAGSGDLDEWEAWDRDWLMELVGTVRAEATAAVAAQVEAAVGQHSDECEWSFTTGEWDCVCALNDVLAALTPDAGAALRAREAKVLRDAAADLQEGEDEQGTDLGVEIALGGWAFVRDWLTDRADALEARTEA